MQMKKQITPCLWYNNQAKNAAAFYCAVFSDSKITTQSPIVTEINISGQKFVLLDGGPMYKPNPSISFYYVCEQAKDIDLIWKELEKEGTVLMPLGSYPWNERYGWITDKFGISWQLALDNVSKVGQRITPCLTFSGPLYGHVDEAITYYSSIFANNRIDEVLQYPVNAPLGIMDKMKHAKITLNNQKFILMESGHHHNFSFSEGVSLSIYCDTQQEIDYYWERLTENGEESMCGWLKDKFGVSWQIIPTILGKIMGDPAKAGKAVQAFMSMRKLNIEQIIQASL